MAETPQTPTNLRTLLILEVLGKSNRAMTATEINSELSLPRQTVHRLCATLERHGFINRQGKSGKYQVARRLRDIGSGLLHNSRDYMMRHQILSDVAQRVGETVNYAVPKEKGMDYLDRVETDWPFRIQLPIGSTVPFHCTASGKTFLSSLSSRKRETFVGTLQLDAKTPYTHTTGAGLLKELIQIRKNGYALDQEEFLEGMIAIAVPITDPNGRFIAALAFHGPVLRINISQAIERKKLLQSAAKQLSKCLFDA